MVSIWHQNGIFWTCALKKRGQVFTRVGVLVDLYSVVLIKGFLPHSLSLWFRQLCCHLGLSLQACPCPDSAGILRFSAGAARLVGSGSKSGARSASGSGTSPGSGTGSRSGPRAGYGLGSSSHSSYSGSVAVLFSAAAGSISCTSSTTSSSGPLWVRCPPLVLPWCLARLWCRLSRRWPPRVSLISGCLELQV